jgi:hypothetical protein
VRTPANNTQWRHSKSGKNYDVITCARMEKTGEWVVVYAPVEHRNRISPKVFIRPVTEWFELVQVEGIRTDRFVPCKNDGEPWEPFYVEREPYGDESKWTASGQRSVGDVVFKENVSLSAVEDDNFKLWSEPQGWLIVYCIEIGDYDVDYRYWNGSTWLTEQSHFAADELGVNVKAAWAHREALDPS